MVTSICSARYRRKGPGYKVLRRALRGAARPLATALNAGEPLRYPSSSIDLGQLAFKRRDRARSARMTPLVWQRAQ